MDSVIYMVMDIHVITVKEEIVNLEGETQEQLEVEGGVGVM